MLVHIYSRMHNQIGPSGLSHAHQNMHAHTHAHAHTLMCVKVTVFACTYTHMHARNKCIRAQALPPRA